MRVPRVTLDMLVAVVALAEKRTIDLAAAELGLGTASALYKRLAAVNRLFQEPLFVNTGEGMALTESGQLLYPEAVRAIEQALLAEEKVTAALSLRAGRLLVGHSTYLPPRLIAGIVQLSFDGSARIEIEHISSLTSAIAQRVTDGTIHVGFGYLPVVQPELLSRVLLEEPLRVCLPGSHALVRRSLLRPLDLANEPVIAIAREPLPHMHQEIEEYFAGFGIKLRVTADAFGVSEALSLVEQGVGICFVGASLAVRPGLSIKPLSPQTLRRRSGLFVREDNANPQVQKFVELSLRTLGKRR